MATNDATNQPSKPPDFSKCIQNGTNSPTCSNQETDRATYQALVNTEMTDWNSLRISQLPPGSSYTLVASQSGTTDYLKYTLTLQWLDDKAESGSSRTGSYTVYIE
jgi:hypothetical protein